MDNALSVPVCQSAGVSDDVKQIFRLEFFDYVVQSCLDGIKLRPCVIDRLDRIHDKYDVLGDLLQPARAEVMHEVPVMYLTTSRLHIS